VGIIIIRRHFQDMYAMKMNIKTVIKAFLIYLLSYSLVYAQTAALLPLGEQQFFDANGKPLVSGSVTFYVPNTSTLSPTWKDPLQANPNTNPVILDGAGRAIIYGNGSYRQVVKDRLNNLIWDQLTASTGTGGGTGTGTGDGNPVGSIMPWSGFIAPPNWVFANGQSILRASFPTYLATVTNLQQVNCTSGSPILTGLSDTTQLSVGTAVESACVTNTTIISKTSTTVTLNNNASVTERVNATFFPYGNGDGSTTFNVVDMRGNVVAGRANMGGTASTNLTSTFCAVPGLNAVCGAQSATLIAGNLPSITPTFTGTPVTPGFTGLPFTPTFTGTPFTPTFTGTPATWSTNQGNLLNATSGNVGATFGGNFSAWSTGTPQIQATVTITPSGTINSITPSGSINAVTPSGNINAITPSGTVSNNGGTSTAFGIVQPTIQLNYIVKVLPDPLPSIATGVTQLGGMVGVIACGTGLTCGANTISASGLSAGGSTTQVQYNNAGAFAGSANLTWVSPVLSIGATGVTGQLNLVGSTSGGVTLQAPATGSGTLTLPTVTDTLIGKATTDILTNKTYNTAGTGNVFQINSTTINAITGSSSTAVLQTSPTLITPILGVATATSLNTPSIFPPVDSNTALQIFKANGSTRIVDIDTSNARVGINKTPGAFDLDVNGAANIGTALTFGITTITGLTANNTPSATNDYLIYYSLADNAIRKCTVGACGSAGSAGVTALNGLTGSLTLTNGTGINVVSGGSTITVSNTGVTSINSTSGTFTQSPQCGRLTFSSTTLLLFSPYNCENIRISGTSFAIPIAGITGCANTSVFVNGSGAANLAASTFYYVYAFSNSGTVTCDFRTDGNGHLPDNTAGNIGTEVRVSSGTTRDSTRTLIGIIFTNGSSQFVDAQTASWFNQRPKSVNLSSTTTSTSTAQTFVTWAGNSIMVTASGTLNNTTTQNQSCQLNLDGAAVISGNGNTIFAQINNYPFGLIWTVSAPTEGNHNTSITAVSNTGTTTCTFANTATFAG
jgi:hypothetical protein